MEDAPPVQQIVRAFNGIRPTQTALGLASVNSVQHWLKTGRILDHYRPRIIEAARELKVKLPKKAVFEQAFGSAPKKRKTDA
jgi:hypothetical protein